MTRLFVRDRKFYGNIIKIAVPIVLQSLITIGVNMADTMMLGTYGEFQLSGSSLANDFINIFQILCMGMGYGAAVLTAQFYGSGEKEKLRKTVAIMLRICLTLATLFMIAVMVVPKGIMELYAKDDEIILMGVKYFRISAYTFIPMGLTLTVTAVLRSVREVKLPLIASILTFFVNIFCNWVFIFGHLGAPEMQIEGAALGTLIARLFEMAVIVGSFLFYEKKIGFRIPHFFMRCGDLLRDYIRYCIPVLVSDSLLALGNTATAMIIGHIGPAFVAANAIISQITRMSTVFTTGVSSSASVLTGNTIGEGRKKEAYEQGITFFMLSILLGIFAGGIILLVSPLVIRCFDITEETRKIAYELMYAVALMVVFQSTQSVLTKGVLRGGGDTRFLMIADIIFLWVASIPLGYLTGIVLKTAAFIIYCALRTDWILKTVLCGIRLFRGKWVEHSAAEKKEEKE